MDIDFIIISDFDGTISCTDTLDIIIDSVKGETYRKAMDEKIYSGEISNSEYLEQAFDSLGITDREMHGFAKNYPNLIDPMFEKFYELVKDKGIGFYILSSGIEQLIRMLVPFVNPDTRIYANRAIVENGIVTGIDVVVDKFEIIKKIKSETNKKIIYIGDGVSDIGVDQYVDVLYVIKGRHLERYCKSNSIYHETISGFKDLVQRFDNLHRFNVEPYVEFRVSNYETINNSYSLRFKTQFEKANGSYLYDVNGKRYVDCLNGFGVNLLGHNHPLINQKGSEFFTLSAPFQVLDLNTKYRDKFIDVVLDFLPDYMKGKTKIQFSGGSGSDAVESAIELARRSTGRDIIMAFSGCYHGLTQGSRCLTGNEKDKVGPHTNVVHMPYCNNFHCPFGLGGETGMNAILHYIENVLDDPKRGFTKPAAIIIETVQSDGGIIPAPNQFITKLREITAKRDILMIVDEVQTGFGKTGLPFGFMHSQIRPDIISCSKAIGGGMPLSCVLYRDDLDLSHRGTFRGNHIALYLGYHVLKYVKDNQLIENVINIENCLKKKLEGLKQKHLVIGETRCKGIMFAIEFDHEGTDRYYSEKAKQVFNLCFKNGLVCKLGGRFNSSLLMWTTFVITDQVINEIFEILDQSISESMV